MLSNQAIRQGTSLLSALPFFLVYLCKQSMYENLHGTRNANHIIPAQTLLLHLKALCFEISSFPQIDIYLDAAR